MEQIISLFTPNEDLYLILGTFIDNNEDKSINITDVESVLTGRHSSKLFHISNHIDLINKKEENKEHIHPYERSILNTDKIFEKFIPLNCARILKKYETYKAMDKLAEQILSDNYVNIELLKKDSSTNRSTIGPISTNETQIKEKNLLYNLLYDAVRAYTDKDFDNNSIDHKYDTLLKDLQTSNNTNNPMFSYMGELVLKKRLSYDKYLNAIFNTVLHIVATIWIFDYFDTIDTQDIEDKSVVFEFYILLQICVALYALYLVIMKLLKCCKCTWYAYMCKKSLFTIKFLTNITFIILLINIIVGRVYEQLYGKKDKRIKNAEWITYALTFVSLPYGYFKFYPDINIKFEEHFK